MDPKVEARILATQRPSPVSGSALGPHEQSGFDSWLCKFGSGGLDLALIVKHLHRVDTGNLVCFRSLGAAKDYFVSEADDAPEQQSTAFRIAADIRPRRLKAQRAN
ncbi:MAG: hypothetical protein AB8B85_11120 [Paracoccaceae bacterium]